MSRPTPFRLPALRSVPEGDAPRLGKAKAPRAPSWLPPAAQAHYERVAGELAALRMTAEPSLLVAFAVTAARLDAATRKLDGAPMTTTTKRGGERQNPLVQIQRDAAAALRLIVADLGLSPTSRAKLGGEPETDPTAVLAACRRAETDAERDRAGKRARRLRSPGARAAARATLRRGQTERDSTPTARKASTNPAPDEAHEQTPGDPGESR